MDWKDLKIHEEWGVHIGHEEGETEVKHIIFHLKCKDGGVLPGENYPNECTECKAEVPEEVLKRLPILLNKDRLIK